MSTASVTRAPEAAAPRRSALWSLTRAEGRRLLCHPVFLLGMAISSATLIVANANTTPDDGVLEQAIVDFLVGDSFLMVGAAMWTFLATFLAASRERRDAAQEIYEGQPAAARTRITASLLSVGYAGAAAAVLIAVATLVFIGSGGAQERFGVPVHITPIALAQGPLYVMLAGVLGVALGTWARHLWIALLVAVALFLPPIALVPWFVFDDVQSRGAFGAVMAGVPPGWHLAAIAGLGVLAASVAVLRHDRRLRVALLAGAGLGATVAVAVAGPVNGGMIVSGCTPPEMRPVGSPSVAPGRGAPGRAAPGNFDFERGNLDGWRVRTRGSGSWRVYIDGRTPPDRSDSDYAVPFNVIDPPQGRFAAVTDMCSAGSRILYRDIELKGRRELSFALFYRGVAPLSSSQTLDHTTSFANTQFRVDVMDPSAPVDSLAPGRILATVFRTTPGDDLVLGPRRVTFDLSPWAGRTVRLRFAQVDNGGPLRVVIDDVRLAPGRVSATRAG